MDRRTLLLALALSFALFGVNLYFQRQHYEAQRTWLAEKERLQKELVSSKPAPSSQQVISKPSKAEEKFYVLETPYQQLVFSNHGGAVVEINLPFLSPSHPNSVVRPIGYDLFLAEHDPAEDRFPGRPSINSEGNAVEAKVGGYYPLLRRGIQDNGKGALKSRYYAFNLLNSQGEDQEIVYTVTHFDPQAITFEAQTTEGLITKKFTLTDPQHTTPVPYCLNLEIEVKGKGDDHYWGDHYWIASGIPEVEWISGAPAPSLKYRITQQNSTTVEKIDPPTQRVYVHSGHPDWICNSNGFLGSILDPLSTFGEGYQVQHIPGDLVRSRLLKVPDIGRRYAPSDLPGYMTLLPLDRHENKAKLRCFAGPFDTQILKEVDQAYSVPEIGYNPDYLACQTMHGWFTFISWPFAKLLFLLMTLFHFITGSWGFSIFLLTLALRIMLYPLNAWSARSMAQMQQIAPEVQAIQEKYKDEPQKAQMEVVELYRARGVNPASGCIPMLIQMPFLVGMFDLLKSSFVLRGVPFIPGWIDDLTAPDVLFQWSSPIPFFGTSFHLLPVLLGGVMFFQQWLTMKLANPLNTPLTDQQRQQRAMSSFMAVLFAVMFYHFPSGLNLYWLFSMLLGILQQLYTYQRLTPPILTTRSETKRAKT